MNEIHAMPNRMSVLIVVCPACGSPLVFRRTSKKRKSVAYWECKSCKVSWPEAYGVGLGVHYAVAGEL